VVVAGAVRAAAQGVIGNGFFVAQLDHGVPFLFDQRDKPISKAQPENT
jgi:hypothetical protein